MTFSRKWSIANCMKWTLSEQRFRRCFNLRHKAHSSLRNSLPINLVPSVWLKLSLVRHRNEFGDPWLRLLKDSVPTPHCTGTPAHLLFPLQSTATEHRIIKGGGRGALCTVWNCWCESDRRDSPADSWELCTALCSTVSLWAYETLSRT